jgi:hypothetical protein
MATLDELKAILDRIAAGKQTKADINALRDALIVSGDQIVVQQGNNNINIGHIGQAGDIHIGDIYQGVSAETIKQVIRQILREEPRLSKEELRNRKVLLNKVRTERVQPFLEQSLYSKAQIELSLEERFDVVDLAWERPEQPERLLPPGTKAITKFDELGAGRRLLILGGPGSGKTTMLRELACDLIERAERDVNLPVPLMFNLSSWAEKRHKIADWLVRELTVKYRLPKEFAQTWIEKQQLLLLLDGLDEVKAECRESCVQAINQFGQKYGLTEMVITSRIDESESAPYHRLRFQRAICIQPLTLEQVIYYLDKAGAKILELKTELENDQALKELFEKPLMLSIFVETYPDISATELQEMKIGQKHLFTRYIARMFEKHRYKPYPRYKRYSEERARFWLTWLAQRMTDKSQTEFWIENLQPYYLPNRLTRWMYAICYRLTFGLGLGALAELTFSQAQKPIFGIVAVLVSCLSSLFIRDSIETLEPLRWSWKNAIKHIKLVLVSTLVFGLITFIGEIALWEVVIGSIIIGFIVFLIAGLSNHAIQNFSFPNQGIWQTFKNAMLFYLIGVVGLGTILAVTGESSLNLDLIELSLLAGLPFGLPFGGNDCVKHLILRFILYTNGFIPWNYTNFLNYATHLLFLKKVGGGYMFIHEELKNNFAQLTSN